MTTEAINSLEFTCMNCIAIDFLEESFKRCPICVRNKNCEEASEDMFQISYLSPKNESQKILRQEAISADNLTFKEAYALFKKINQGNYPEECKILVRWYKKMTGHLIHSNQALRRGL